MPGKRLSDVQIEECKELMNEGWTYGQLSLKFGVSRQCIQQRVEKSKKRDIENAYLKRENIKLAEQIKAKDEIIRKLQKKIKLMEVLS